MRLNTKTAISTPKVLLVPYSKWHVPRYHEWMKDEEIQQATASEPLSVEEEYAMQRSWREDADKLTFIVCLPSTSTTIPDGSSKDGALGLSGEEHDDSPARMIGDINLFLRIDDGDEGDAAPEIIGEIELMIAEKKDQGKGFGKAALLAFLRYVLGREGEVVGEFLSGGGGGGGEGTSKGKLPVGFAALSVKIGQGNERSLKLFEGLGFRRVGEEPNYFGEWELRKTELGDGEVEGYREVVYARTE
ncbi:GNAT domain-containing protein [Aspergillus varians]